MDVTSRKSRVAWLSVLSNTCLVVLKIIVGLAIGSVSVISEAIHSGVDLLAAAIALFAVKTAGKPADEDHPFGHGKMENLSGTIEAVLIFVAAGWIIWEALGKFVSPAPMESTGWGVAVMGFSTLVNLGVSHALFKVGRDTDSIALQADAWHLRTDIYTSVGVMGALAIIWAVGRVAPGVNLDWIDPAAAICVALLIVKAAFDLTVQSGRDLLDGRLPDGEERWIAEYLEKRKSVIKAFHHLRTRKAGAQRFIEFHILVDPEMSVEKSHDLTGEVKHAIRQRLSEATVMIHVEPYHGEAAAQSQAR